MFLSKILFLGFINDADKEQDMFRVFGVLISVFGVVSCLYLCAKVCYRFSLMI